MKKFFFLGVLIILLTVLLSSNRLNACPIDACFSNSCTGCTAWSGWVQESYTLTLPAYPGCRITFYYCFNQCTAGLPPNERCWEVEVFDFELNLSDYTCGNCSDFINWLNTGTETEKAYKLSWMMKYAWYTINMAKFTELKNQTPPESWPYCDEDVYVKCHSSTASCKSFCYIQHPVSNPSIPLKVTQVNCTDTYCCVHELQICIDRQTGDIIPTDRYIAIPPTTCTGTAPLNSCPAGENVFVSPCIDDCIH
jgi:hypothetical protein